MANKTIDLRKLRQVLQLYTQGVIKLSISRQLDLLRNTVRKYISLFHEHKITYEKLTELPDHELEELFTGLSVLPVNSQTKELEVMFPYFSKELKKVGVSRYLLW